MQGRLGSSSQKKAPRPHGPAGSRVIRAITLGIRYTTTLERRRKIHRHTLQRLASVLADLNGSLSERAVYGEDTRPGAAQNRNVNDLQQ